MEQVKMQIARILNEEPNTSKEVEEMKKELIGLIERDTPKKVYSTDYYYCPNCDTHYLTEYQKFCDWCGQRLDWSWKRRKNNE